MGKVLTITISLLAILSVLVYLGIPIPLGSLDSRLERLAGSLIDREVRIDGPSRLIFSLHPSLTIKDLSIGNPVHWNSSEPFLHAHEGTARIDLLALLKGQIRIEALELEKVAVNLITGATRETNFTFAPSEQSLDSDRKGHEFTGLDTVRLSEIQVNYQDQLSGKSYELVIDEARGSGAPDEPLLLSASGRLSGTSCSVDITGGPLQDLLRGNRPWPLTNGRLLIGEVSLETSGSLNLGNSAEAGYLSFALGGKSLDSLADLFGLPLPDIGEFGLSSRIGISPGGLHVMNLQVEAQGNSLSGDLVVSFHGTRPLLGGNILISMPVPESLMSLAPETPASDLKKDGGDDQAVELPWHLLQALDADIVLRIGDISRDNLELKDIKAVVSLVDGDLIVPAALDILDLPFNGFFEAAAGDHQPVVSGVIASSGGDLGALFKRFDSDSRMEGRLGPVSVTGGSAGKTAAELLEELEIAIKLGDSAFSSDGKTVIATETVSIEIDSQKSAVFKTTGELLERPLDLQASFVDSSLGIDLEVCDSEFKFKGRKVEDENGGSEFDLRVEGEKLCGLIDPLARFVDKSLGFSVTAGGSFSSEGLKIDLHHGRIGDLTAGGHLELQRGKEGRPRLSGEIRSPKLNLAHFIKQIEAEKSAAAPVKRASQASDDQVANLDQYEQSKSLINQILAMEVMPIKKYLATEVKLKIGVEEIVTGMIGVSEVELTIDAEKGKLRHSPFQARIGGSLFTGSAAIDLSDEVPSAHLDLATDYFSLPELLKELAIEQVPEVSAAHLGLEMSFEGKTVKEMLLEANYHAQLRGGKIIIDRAPLDPLTVNLEQADYLAYADQPAMMSVNGEVNSLPLHLESQTSGFFARGTEKPVILSLQGNIGDNRVEIDGRINRKKQNLESFSLSSGFSGVQLDTLNELLGLDLPPLGPYELAGTLASRADKSVGLYDMGLRIGDSVLNGELILKAIPGEEDGANGKISLQTRLESRTIQLNDFQFGQWSPVTGSRLARVETDTAEAAESESSLRMYDLFSEEVAEKIMGTLEVLVQEVLSGEDQLGHGYLKARLEKGVYMLDDLQLGIPGGTVQISGKLEPQREKVGAELLMNIEDFDYGILIRRRQPESALKGLMNLNLDLKFEAASPALLNENLNGSFRLGIIPEEFISGAFDLWAVNIITSALPILMKGNTSVVNCLAGDFTIEQGLMQPEVFVLDTSKMRVSGKGTVNFKTNEIDFVLRPKPKRAQLFSLATPVAVTGSLLNPDIGVTTAAVVGTIFRQPISVITVPLQWLFTDNLEKDGTKVCSEAMQWVKKASEE